MVRRLGGNRRHHESSSRARRCGEDEVSYLLRSSDPWDPRHVMADATERPRSEVEAGDEVLATNPQTGETSAREVRNVERRSGV
jgi:hypothetical protein